MKPLRFKEAQIELKKPPEMTDKECSSLWVYKWDNQCISLWTASFWQRLKFTKDTTINIIIHNEP